MVDCPKSLELQKKAKKRIPGMTQLLSKRPDQFSEGVWPGYFQKAQGVEIWDLDGNRYTDMSISSIGANILGYADPDVNEAVTRVITDGNSSSLNSPEEVELADLLCELHPWAEMARFTRCGGESMAVAVRIARCFTNRDKIAFCGYHGWHDWYLAANLGTENVLGEHLLSGLNPRGVPQGLKGTALPFRYNHLEELEAIVAKSGNELAAIVMEPVRSTSPQPGFLQGVRDLANKTGAVFIIDEISSGFRICAGGAHLTLGVTPDMAVFSKAMGNGYPIGAIIGKGHIMDAAQNTFISSTYWTERVGPAAAIATIRKFREVKAHEHMSEIGSQVQRGWKTLAEKHSIPLSVSGLFPLSHFAFQGEQALSLKALFVQLMLEEGFLASNSLYTMYAHKQEHAKRYLEAVDRSFQIIAAALQEGNVSAKLKGKPSSSGFKRLA